MLLFENPYILKYVVKFSDLQLSAGWLLYHRFRHNASNLVETEYIYKIELLILYMTTFQAIY